MRTVLRGPKFRLLFTGMVASMIGDSILLLALAIWVKSLTGSDGMAGATLFAIVAPMALLGPMVGWVVDRFRRRPFFIAVNVATAAALLPLLLVRGRGDVWIIYAVGVLYGLSYIAINGALSGLIQEIVPSAQLAEANGALQTVKQGLRLVGPLIGAGIFAAVGGWLLAVVAAAGFLAAAGTVAFLRVREERPGRPELHWLAEVVAGVRHLAGEPGLRRVTLGTAIGLLVIGFGESAFFAFVDKGLHRSPAFLGVLVCVQGIGGLLGGLVSARLVRVLGEIATAALGLAVFVPISFAVLTNQLVLVLPAMALAGAGIPFAVVGLNTLMQRRTPAAVLGRVASATEALLSGPQALSIAVGAVLVTLIDYRLLFLAAGLVMALGGTYLWRGRRLSPPAAPAVPDPGMPEPAVPDPGKPEPAVPDPMVAVGSAAPAAAVELPIQGGARRPAPRRLRRPAGRGDP